MNYRITAIVCVLGVWVLGGCATNKRGGTVTFSSAETGKALAQTFNQAYITQAKAGEYEIVLVDNAADWNYDKADAKKPIKPMVLPPLRQVMHIHLYWRPLMGTTKNPAAVNASIHWYVMGADGTKDILAYEGAGYVSLRGGGGKRTVIIRDAQLKPAENRGGLTDPIGEASLRGTLVARVNDVRVQDAIAEVKKQAE